MTLSQTHLDETRLCNACGAVFSCMRAACPECHGWYHKADAARAKRAVLPPIQAPPRAPALPPDPMLQRANEMVIALHERTQLLEAEIAYLKRRLLTTAAAGRVP